MHRRNHDDVINKNLNLSKVKNLYINRQASLPSIQKCSHYWTLHDFGGRRGKNQLKLAVYDAIKNITSGANFNMPPKKFDSGMSKNPLISFQRFDTGFSAFRKRDLSILKNFCAKTNKRGS